MPLRTLLLAGHHGDGAAVFDLSLGPFPARVVVQGGDVLSATAGPFVGEDALLRLLLVPRRPVRSSTIPTLPAPQTLGTVSALLASCDAAEAALTRGSARVGGFDRVWSVHYPALRALLPELPEDVKRVVRLLDGTRDVRTLLAESPLPPALTVRVLDKLLVHGALVRADVPPASAVDKERQGGADRSWLDARSSRAPEPASAPTSSSPAPAEAPAPHVLSSPPSSSPSAPTPCVTDPRPPPSSALPDPAPPPPSSPPPSTPLAAAPRVPRPDPRDDAPRPELSAWLGPEEEFFAAHPTAARWPAWSLVVLVWMGAAIGVVVGRAFLP